MPALSKKFTLADLRAARRDGRKIPMLTCYDFTTARLMHAAGVPTLLVGDSAASVILGHDTTLPAPLEFMIEITAAVRRGAPMAMVVADMPFGSYQRSPSQAVKNVARMVQLSGCDAVKIETTPRQSATVSRLADAGVAVIVHLGLRPQAAALLGGYLVQGRSAAEAENLCKAAEKLVKAGAAAILLEAAPAAVAEAVVERTNVPVIGCGAGPACCAHVVVTQDALGLGRQSDGTPTAKARFVPELADLATPTIEALSNYVRQVTDGAYPAAAHEYRMPPDALKEFLAQRDRRRPSIIESEHH